MHCGLSAYAPLDRPEEDGDAAREGTCAAWVAELVINGDATCAEDMLGKVHKNGWEVDEEMVKHINAYLAILPRARAGRGLHADASILRARRTTSAGHDEPVITDLKYGYR